MKIAILTLPLKTNYGGILQAYALQTILKRMGHDVKVLDKPRVYKKPAYWKYPFRALHKLLINKHTVIKKEKFAKVREQGIQQFIKRHIHTHLTNSLADISEKDFDCFVVGSDQVWRSRYFCRMWQTTFADAFLSFTRRWNIKRIAYAPSFGVDHWAYEGECDSIIQAIQQFDAVSVREASGITLCREHLDTNAHHVLDPTMLLTKEDYTHLFTTDNTPESPGDLFCYVLDDNVSKNKLIQHIAQEKNLTPYHINKQHIKPSITMWLRGFHDAKFVVTDSFHACVFSILFGKPFIAVGNVKRGMERFRSLLGMFGLEENLITDISSYKSDYNYTPCKSVDERLSQWREISHHFLAKELA